VSEELLRLAGKDRDSGSTVTAHFMLGFSLLLMGDLAPAEEHYTQGLKLYRHGQSIQRYTFLWDPGIGCYCNSSRTLWLLGFPHKALERIQQAIALFRSQADLRGLALAIGMSVGACDYRNDYPGIQEHAEAVIAIAREKDIADYLAPATIFHGYALAMQDRLEEGIAEIREGLGAMRIAGTDVFAPEWMSLLIKALMKAGRIEESLAYVAEALAIINRTGERHWEGEIHRLKGESLLQSAAGDKPTAISDKRIEAEACFQKAIEFARRQQARSLELRATMSLARLWRQQGKTAEERQALAEIYNWFTESLDTSDLQDAEALLEELRRE